MQKTTLTAKHICAIFIAFLPLAKIISAPSYLAKLNGERLWQPLVILLIFDVLLLAFLLFVCKKHKGKSFYEILSENYSTIFAKIIVFVYGAFFFAKSILPLFEQKTFIESAFYETLPQAPVFYPAFIVIFYFAIKNYKVLARTAQFCAITTCLGFLLILFLSLPSSEFKYLLPLFSYTNKSAPISALTALSWFNDGIYFLMLIKNFNHKKGDGLKIIGCFLAVFFAVILFYLTFYGIFSFVAHTQNLAISSVGIFSVALVNVGRFDYIALFLISFSSIISVCLPINFSVKCFTTVFGVKREWIVGLAVTLLALVLTVIYSTKYTLVFNFITTYFTPLFLVCGYLLPLLCLRRKKDDLQKG